MPLNKVARMVRSHGLPRTAHWAAYRVAKRLVNCDITEVMWLDRQCVNLPHPIDPRFEFRFLTADEVRKFASEPLNDLDTELADRLDGGRDYCFAAIDDGRLAAYAWYAVGSIEARHNSGSDDLEGVALSYPNHVAFMYKGMVHPDFRGQKLYGLVNGQALEHLGEYAVTALLSTADWTNWPALRSCAQLGYVRLGRCWTWEWLDRWHVRFPQAAQERGIRSASRAKVESRDHVSCGADA